jgi:replicative DNA helicase
MNPHDLDTAALPRVPPHSAESEAAVLGGLLLDNAMFEHVGDLLAAEDFYRHENRLVFAAIAGLIGAGKPADVVTVFDGLQGAGKAGEAGGMQYLNALAQYVPSAGNMRRYAEIVRERALLRAMIGAADEMAASAFSPCGADAGALLDRALGRLQSLQLRGAPSRPVAVESLAVSFIDRVQALADGQAQPGIPTRIPTLDRMLGGGVKPGKQIIVAARPSVGKSSFAEQLCLTLASDGHACAILSQEMGRDELADRAVANLGRVSLERLGTGKLAGDEWERLSEGVQALRGLPLYLDDQPGLMLSDIRAKARLLVRQHGVKLIVLDYLQLCASSKDDQSRHHQIEELSRGVKNLAKELCVTFVSLSQLGREVEKRASGRPVLSDLKESGSIEEDADVVLLLSRHEGSRQQIVCDVPKNRQGRTGEFGLIFEGEFQHWTESAEPFYTAKKQSRWRPYTEDV